MNRIALSLTSYAEGFLHDSLFKNLRLEELASAIRIIHDQLAHLDRLICGRDPVPTDMLPETKFMDATEKRRMLGQWEKFVKGGFPYHLFTDAVYNHLILHCGFIAHYNRR
ncbi:MAG: hypothetical protein A4E57_04420 [Syntrophorhabdaceae bacterium PtaU1.Bin034]|nr:MAG: hypothetical protein A4E57_04420 [Syntrophorhabdaceae bacterium PtaU1.Bin034]